MAIRFDQYAKQKLWVVRKKSGMAGVVGWVE